MAITTYAELQTAISNWLDRSDLTARIPEFIALAEVDIFDEIQVRELETRADITINSRYVSVPSDFSSVRRLHIETAPLRKIKFVAPDQINDFYQSANGLPRYYTVIGTEFEFNRAPDSSYPGKLVYYQTPLALSDSQTTNDIFPAYKNIYLYGALLQAEPFLGNDKRIAMWGTLYETAMKRANNASKNDQYQGTTIQMRADIANP